MKDESKFLVKPEPASDLYHVFGMDGRSLCGRYGLLKMPKEKDKVTGSESYQKGQDCKKCFEKANLKTN